MKAYKIFRWFLRASALTTVMFIMQACYGTYYDPNMHEIKMKGIVVDKTSGKPLLGIVYAINDVIFGYTDENGEFDIWQYDVVYSYQLSFADSTGQYRSFDTVVEEAEISGLRIKLESNE